MASRRCQSCSARLFNEHPELPRHCQACGDRWIRATYRVVRKDDPEQKPFRVLKSSVRWWLDIGKSTLAVTVLRRERLAGDVPYYLPVNASTRSFGYRVTILDEDHPPAAEAPMKGVA